MSKRTVEAIGLFEKALAMDPESGRFFALAGKHLPVRKQLSLRRSASIERANRVDDRNIEILLELAKDLEGAKRYEDALQTLQKMLRIEPDNLTAFIRKRDLLIRLEKWSEALEIQHRTGSRPTCLNRNAWPKPISSPAACMKWDANCWNEAIPTRPVAISAAPSKKIDVLAGLYRHWVKS